MSGAAKTRENTGSVAKEHKFLSGNRGNLCVEEQYASSLRKDDGVYERKEERDYKDYRGDKQRSPSGQLISRVVRR